MQSKGQVGEMDQESSRGTCCVENDLSDIQLSLQLGDDIIIRPPNFMTIGKYWEGPMPQAWLYA